MRIFCFYIVIILIALQSVNAISEINDNHQQSHQNTHQNIVLSTNLRSDPMVDSSLNQQGIISQHQSKHQDSDHHSRAELLAFQAQALAGELQHSDADHPDCHANHCHHSHQSNLVYVDLSAQVHLAKTADKQVINKNALFNSLLISPASRPPIV